MKKILLTAFLINFVFAYGQNLILHYALNDTASSTLPANGLYVFGTGVAVGIVDYGVTGMSADKCAFFKNGQGYVSSNPISNSGWSGMAISVWYKSPSTFAGTIVQGAYLGFGLRISYGGKIQPFFDGTELGSLSSTSSVNDNEWHHILVQNNGNTTSIYIDGVFENSQPEVLYTASGTHPAAFVYLGTAANNDQSQKIHGRVDEVKIFDNVLTQAQIDVIFQSTTPCSPSFITDVITTCQTSYTWIDGNTYTSNNNNATYTLQNAVGCDSLITLDLTLNATSASSSTHLSCGPYAWNGSTYYASGTYYWTGTNAAGCDSIVTLNLTIPDFTPTITGDVNLLETVNPSSQATFQWIDCSNNVTIQGATNSSYVPTYNGSFAVVVSMDGCLKMSNCIAVSTVGLVKNEKFNLSVFPNPAKDIITIKTDATIMSSDIYNISGSLVATFKGSEYSVSHLKAGVYFINVKTEIGIAQHKFVKQ